MGIKGVVLRAILYLCSLEVAIRWFFLEGYYYRLAVQARHLYKQSDLFKMRWQEVDLEYAENSFENVGDYFFEKAKKEPFIIRWAIFKDALFNRPFRSYYIEDD